MKFFCFRLFYVEWHREERELQLGLLEIGIGPYGGALLGLQVRTGVRCAEPGCDRSHLAIGGDVLWLGFLFGGEC